jgi:imidazolonepropionase
MDGDRSVTRTLWTGCNLATMAPRAETPYGLIEDAAMVTDEELIRWVGPRAHLPQPLAEACKQRHKLHGALVTPGFIDCHTHLVYAGNRAAEFELRLNGASYEEVARAGGGIVSTVRATREASAEEMERQSLVRLQRLMLEGVTTVEIKSGYGLDLATERKMLQVARSLGQRCAAQVRTSFLGAHAVPAEYAGQPDAYIDEVLRMLTTLHAEGLVDAVDAFCERIAFSTAQTERVFSAAKEYGLPVKLHAEQLSDSGGAQLAARYGALSADHLEWLSEEGAQAMAQAGTAAVLLPTAFYFLRETKVPPIDMMRRHGLAMAVATDCNPGSSPCTSMLLALNMACTLFRLTPEEALVGATRAAAQALGLKDRGVLAQGMRSDFVAWGVERPAELCYGLGSNPRIMTVLGGAIRDLVPQNALGEADA